MLGGPVHRRAGLVDLPALRQGTDQTIHVVRFEVVGRGRQSHQIGHPVQGNGGGEPFTGGQSIEGGQAPGTSAPNTHTAAVDAARGGQMAGGVNAVLGIGHPPLPPERAAIGPPVARAAGVVHSGHGKTPTGEVLHGDVEPGPGRRRRPTVTGDDQRGEGAFRSRRLPQLRRVHHAMDRTARAPDQVERLPHRHVGGCQRDGPTGSERARRLPRRRQHPHVVGPVGRSADVRHAVTVPAQRADGDARLGEHLRGRLRGGDVHERVSAARRPASHQGAIAHLDHRRLPEDPVRAVKLGLLVGHRFGRMRPGRTRMEVGLPPALPIRDKAQAPIEPPGRLPHRLVRAPGHHPGRTGGGQPRGRGGSGRRQPRAG